MPLLTLPGAAGPAGAPALALRMWPARRRLARSWDMAGRLVHVAMASPWDMLYLPVAKRAGARILLTVHDAEPHPGDENRFAERQTDKVIALADHIAVLSSHVGTALEKRLPAGKKVHLVQGGLSTVSGPAAAPRAFPEGRPVRLLFFGRILHYKGLDLLLDALPLLRDQGFDVQLTIAGSGDLAPHAGRLAALDNVTVRQEWISDEEKARLFADSDVNVLPYREASQSGIALDGLCAALPSVATRLGGLTEQLTEGKDAVMADAPSPPALAAALAQLLSDPALYRRLSEGAHESALALGPEKVAEAWTSLYRSIEHGDAG